jgi:hypothetical protein
MANVVERPEDKVRARIKRNARKKERPAPKNKSVRTIWQLSLKIQIGGRRDHVAGRRISVYSPA